MPDKKLTDKEIIKALELLLELVLVEGCLQRAKTISNALALINRLQAENEQKDKNYIELLKTSSERAVIIGEQGAEIERLKTELDFAKAFRKETDAEFSLMHRKYGNMLKTAKAEAYKECIEEAKENIKNLEYNAKTPRKTVKVEELEEQMDWVLHTVIIETLDNLLKELGGE